MLTLMDIPPFLEDMEKKSKQLGQSIAAALEGHGEDRVLTRESELLTVSPSSLIHILKGVFRCQHGEKTIRLYSSGDLLLAPGVGEAGGLSISSEFGSQVRVVPKESFLAALSGDPSLLSDWLAYQALESRIVHLLCSLYIVEDVKHEPEIRQYSEGDVIIREDDRPNEVYEMLTGTASVTSKGTDLSRIKATVTALEDCLVQVIDQQQFLRIMKYRPAMVDGLIRTLCNRLVDLNVKVSAPR
jgi:hypothetical protein